jgi:FKBP-type peptidyl-prolyl cis-trans isomerase FkpA
VKSSARSPLMWLLVLSLTGNAGLIAWCLRLNSVTKSAATPDLAVSAPALPTPTPTPKKEAPLPFALTAYASLGSYLSQNNHIASLHWSEEQFDAFIRGMRADYEGRGYVFDDETKKLRDEISAKVQAQIDSKKSNPVEDYFKVLREREGVQKTPSGLHYRVTDKGFGKPPAPDSTILVSYTARLPTGEHIESLSRPRVRTAVRDLLPGLAEGVQLISPRGKALIYVPPALSFGDGPWPKDVPKGAPIVFFVELHEIFPSGS